jgi:hypothetical protein
MELSNTQLATAVNQAVEVSRAIAETIRDIGEIPSGTLYAIVMSHLTLSEYESIIEALVTAGLVTNHGYLLQWVKQ